MIQFQLEKKMRVDHERNRRRLEGEFKIQQEYIMDLENDKMRLAEKLRRAKEDQEQLELKYNDEAQLVLQLGKKIKVLYL